ncbi:MAG: homocysteine S-methyltransferase family protein [Pseudomonadota bacterium]
MAILSSDEITLLDGAVGTELRARGVQVRDYRSSLWSALACVEAPEAVTRLHLDYINAGADVITLNNYAITPVLLAREGREEELEPLIRATARCAAEARDRADRKVLLAGSLPPLNTSYAADLVDRFSNNLATYRRLVAILNPLVDCYLCETLSTAEEARAAATAADQSGKPFMVSWTIERTGRGLRGGDSFAAAVDALKGLTPQALLVNCSSTSAITAAIPHLRQLSDLPIGGYANPIQDEPAGGEPLRVIRNPLTPDQYAHIARDWFSAGATIVGGCCDTSPAYTAALARMARDAKRRTAPK